MTDWSRASTGRLSTLFWLKVAVHTTRNAGLVLVNVESSRHTAAT